MATDLQYREGLTDTQKNQLVTRLDRIKAGSAITETDKANFNYGLGSSWQSYLSPSVDFNNLGNTKSPVVPPAPTPNDGSSVMAGLNGIQNAQQQQLTAQQQQIENDRKYFQDIQMMQGTNPAETAYNQSIQGLKDLQTKEATKTQALAEAYKSGGVEEYQKKLDELNLQASQLQGSYLQGLTSVEGKVMPMQFITGQQAQMQKQYATQAASVALQQQALQGNIENAKSIAKEMVDLQYGDVEKQIAYQKDLINLNYDNLTRSEKKRADELNYILDQQAQRVAEAKAMKENINQVLADGIKLGIDSETIQKIMNSKDTNEAISYLGPRYMEMKVQEEEQQALDNSLKLQQLAVSRINATKSSSSPSSNGVLSSITKAVIENPNLYTGFTATQKAQVVAELNANGYDTSNLGTKPLSDSAISTITDFSGALTDLEYLKKVIEENKENIGPITGLEALNPWSSKRKIQADIDRIKQTVGKALEGGVLRKEDEEKYKKILATITDTPETALYKVDSIISSLQNKLEEYTDLQQAVGKSTNVTASLQLKNTSNVTDLRNKYNY